MKYPKESRTAYIIASIFAVGALSLLFHLFSISPTRLAESVISRTALAQVTGTGSDLVGYWTLDEGSGSTAVDSSGNNNTGTEANGPRYISGKVGTNALLFDGSNQYVNLGDASTLNITGLITLSAWVNFSYFTSNDNGCGGYCGVIVGKGNNGTNEGYILRYVDQGTPELTVGSYNGNTYGATWPITFGTGSWHHVVGLYDGTEWELYVDGALVASTAASTGAVATTANAAIGGEFWNEALVRYFPGAIDDVRVYGRALSSGEVSELYALGTGTGGTPPAISDVGSSSVGPFQATVSWTTDGLDSGQAIYGTSASYGNSTPLYPTGSAPHSIVLSDLLPGTLYHFAVVSRDPAGDLTTSPGQTFTTPALVGVSGPNFYVAETAAGNENGSDCNDALSVNWLNSASSWGGGGGASSQIGPGDIVHLCGTIAKPISVLGSGTSGNPITIHFETNAKMSAPYWPQQSGGGGGAITIRQQDCVTIDGGTDGVIEATDNGTAFDYQLGSVGVDGISASYLTVENLTVNNMYVHTSDGVDGEGTTGIRDWGEQGTGFSHFIATNNTVHDAYDGIYMDYGIVSNVEISHNTIYDVNWGGALGERDSSATASDISIHDNHIYSFANWDESTDGPNHHNGFFIWSQTDGTVNDVNVYNNTIGPNFGQHSTSALYFSASDEAYLTDIHVYNNIFVATDSCPSPGMVTGIANDVFDNTFIGSGGCTALDLSGNDPYIVKNNIFSDVGTAIFLSYSPFPHLSSDDNLFYPAPDPSAIYYAISNNGNADSLTLAEWQAQGLDDDSTFADPKLSGAYIPQSGSAAIGAGADLTSLGIASLDSDIVGTSRPTGCAPWDIGAYESAGGSGGSTSCTLSVTKPSGGTITSSPSGIDCGPGENACSQSGITQGSIITLTEAPSNGYIFGGWSGCTSATGNSCTVDMASNMAVTAAFDASGGFTPPTCTVVCGAALKGYWPFEEGSGSVAFDSSGNYDNGTQVNSPSYVTGAVGSHALSFNGSTQYVNLGDPLALQITSQITLSAWVDFSSFISTDNGCGGYCGAIVAKGNDGSSEGYVLRYLDQGGTPSLGISSYNNGTTYGTASWPIAFGTGSWHHVVGLYDGTDWKLYVDGALEENTDGASGALSSAADVTIGGEMLEGSPARFFPGAIDDVRIYSQGLTSTEVGDLYALGPGGGSPPPTTYSLTVASPTGGSITSSDSAISCGSTCVELSIPTGTSITLTEAPATGYAFASWGGACAGTATTCPLTISGNDSVSASFTSVAPPPPGTPPTLFSISAGSITSSSAIITWTTDISATDQVEYGLTTAYGNTSAENTTLVTSHTQTLTGLSPNTLYHYAVISSDGAGDASTSNDLSFTTAAAPTTPAPVNTSCCGGGGGGGGGNSAPVASATVSRLAVAVAPTSAIISWVTPTPFLVQVSYGLTTAYGSHTALTALATTTHGALLSGLSPDTLYHYVLLSESPYQQSIASTVDSTFITSKTGTAALPVPPALATTASIPLLTVALSLGSSNTQVKILQELLNDDGYQVSASGNGSPGHESTYFGPATLHALVRFQCAAISVCGGAPGSGLVGPKTRTALNALGGHAAPSRAPAIPSVPTPVAVSAPASAPSEVSASAASTGALPSSGSATFTRTLIVGSTGPDVTALQKFLNAHGFLVAASGPDSPGAETTSYDASTAAAVSRFQNAYASEILAPYGLTQGTGVFGTATRKVVEGMKGE